MAEPFAVHLYVSRKYQEERYKLLCTNEYTSPTHFQEKPWGRSRQIQFTTMKHKVTCPQCLKIIVPRMEDELMNMRKHLEAQP